ncbi:LysR family transcriptional regulator [Sphingomonas sp. C8-2]|jgi:DNA-binding transcriptional LysR family regulator|uniref:LysR family transcriptional regulator n=1 Tax=Rhizorhabdus histidinilytica TaxID=439228 RepID=UPI000F78FBA5|nr:LysR family transcriptional regulator [Sphingomonas sp. C8-2]
MLDPRLLRAFVAIADHRSFTSAAAALNMTQSTISQQLARLEQGVGRALIDRAARPVLPTPAGERLLGHARRILALHAEAERLLTDPAGTHPVRIGMPDDIATHAMTGALAAFAGQHRDIRLDVTIGLSRELTRRYHGGELDIVVVKEARPGPDHRISFAEPMAWYEGSAAPDWPDPIPLVAFPAGGLYRDEMFARIEREGRRWYVALTSSSLSSVLVAVETGMGISLLPCRSTLGRDLRIHAPLGRERPMAVSLYGWETAGPIGELADRMIEVLAGRDGATTE